jgi:HlyD family secretion protein
MVRLTTRMPRGLTWTTPSVACALLASLLPVACAPGQARQTDELSVRPTATATATATVERRTVTRTVRLHGTIEAASSVLIVVPRLAGQQSGALVITRLVANGTRVAAGEVLVEFDRQSQLDAALEKRAEWRDLDEQVRRLQAQHTEAAVKDETLLKAAENALALARLEVEKNTLLPRIEAEKNLLSRDAAEAEHAQVQKSLGLKRRAAAAERRTLEIRRDRALAALRHAEQNADVLSVRAPMDGLVVLRSIWKSGRMGEPQEGEEVRGGLALLDVVGETAMQVRVRLNQADLGGLAPGQEADVTLDAYPDRQYAARLEHIAPVALTGMSDKVRVLVAVFTLADRDEVMTPDLSAAVDVRVAHWPDALVVPRDAVGWREGMPGVHAGGAWRPVSLAGLTNLDAVLTGGVQAGDRVVRHAARLD